MRSCPVCGADMAEKRSNAVYCSRTCKTRASDARRITDRRGVVRDRARYPQEAERRRAYARQYLVEHPEEMRLVRRRRKGQIRAESFPFTDRDWRRMVARYRGCCAYCGKRSATLHREHVIPLARGGRHSVGNIVPACPTCNFRKHTRLLVEFLHDTPGRR